MAVTRRGYIFGAFLSSVLSVLLIVVAVSSDNWVVSTASSPTDVFDGTIQYGLFGGDLLLYSLTTPVLYSLHMTCISSLNACALSCKTDEEARMIEVEAMANGYRFTPTCGLTTDVNTTDPLPVPPVISFALYICLLLIIFLQLIFAVISAGLAIINATKNPTESVFGLSGCLWANCVTALLGLTVMLLFGIYWATSGLKDHLAISYIAFDFYTTSPSLGFSYWILIASILCNLANVGLITLRAYLLERDPPPPTIEVENHSDGTIFLY